MGKNTIKLMHGLGLPRDTHFMHGPGAHLALSRASSMQEWC